MPNQPKLTGDIFTDIAGHMALMEREKNPVL